MNTLTTPSSTVVTQGRGIERVVAGRATSDGAGVKLTRVLTQDLQQRLDPFLMLDAFGSDDASDYNGGFPNHPHRGFETVTYMIAGRMRHSDSAGHSGLLQNGGVQWMTAGRGVIHSEMPEQESGRLEGFQLWLNLPGKDKMCAPWYQDFQSETIPQLTTDQGVLVRVIAGQCQGTHGAMQRPASTHPTEPLYLDLHFPADAAHFSQPLAASHNAFIYVYRGSTNVVDAQGRATAVPSNRMAILKNVGDGLTLTTDPASAEPARVLLIAGAPLGEPIAQYGPFVMNTRAELQQAVDDFNAGRLG